MSRRQALPGADELFRRTEPTPGPTDHPTPVQEPADTLPNDADQVRELTAVGDPEIARVSGARATRSVPRRRPKTDRRPTGRERHEEKITVYVSPEEVLDLEQAKLTLRGQHGLAVDRGRIVREAIAMIVADLETGGEHSVLVRRLRNG